MERHNHRLLIGTINISLERRALLEPLEAVQRRYNPDDQDSRYNKVRVAFGKRVEPWGSCRMESRIRKRKNKGL